MQKNLITEFIDRKGRPLVLGHRGAQLEHQENSYSSFKKSLEDGYDGIELDVTRLKDGRLVIFHDDTTERLTGVKGTITEMTWEEVSKLRIPQTIDVGCGLLKTYPTEERILLFEEFLEEFKNKFIINVELKASPNNWKRKIVGAEVANMIKKSKAEDSIIVTSFSIFMLKSFKEVLPQTATGLLYGGLMIKKWPNAFIMFSHLIDRMLKSDIVNLDCDLINQKLANSYRQAGLSLGTYTLFSLDPSSYSITRANHDLSEAELVRKLAKYGVQWFITDDPIQTVEILNSISIKK